MFRDFKDRDECGELGGTAFDILGFYDFFGSKSNGDLMDALLDIQDQLIDINDSIEQLISAVDKSAIQTQYISAQRVIMESIRCFNNYANMTKPEDKAY